VIEKKFVICGVGRCGTHLLSSHLESHPDVCFLDELLGWRRPERLSGASVADAFDYIADRVRAADRKVVGFDLKYEHAGTLSTPFSKLWAVGKLNEMLLEDGYCHIHVTRRDHLACYVSFKLATRQNRWMYSPYLKEKIRIDVCDLIEWVKWVGWTKGRINYITDSFPSNRYFETDYEDVQAGVFSGVAGFLGLGGFKMFNSRKYEKQMSGGVWSFVENEDEVRQCLEENRGLFEGVK